MSFNELLEKLEGVRLRVTPEGDLQAKGLSPELRPAVREYKDQLCRYFGPPRLEAPRIRWAYPPCAAHLYAWMPGADTTRIPPGMHRLG